MWGVNSCFDSCINKFLKHAKTQGQTVFGLGYEVQSCWKLKNEQGLQGANNSLIAVSANFSNTQKRLKT